MSNLFPYAQFLSRYAQDLTDCISLFHKLNAAYNDHYILSVDSLHWEIFDLRISQPIAKFKFKHLTDFHRFMSNLMYDIGTVHLLNSCFRGQKKLSKSELYSCKRILNMYGFDEYFFTNKKLINYIVYGEINKKQNCTNCD